MCPERARDVRAATRDRGISLIEVLVGVAVSTMLIGVVAAAVAVSLRSAAVGSARIDGSAVVQRLQRVLDLDLASATQVITAADASPCGDRCPQDDRVTGGVNIVQLSALGLDGSIVTTAYRAVDVDAGAGTIDLRVVRATCREPAAVEASWACAVAEVAVAPLPACVAATGPVVPDWLLRVAVHQPSAGAPGRVEIGVRDPAGYCDAVVGGRYADPDDAGFDVATFSASRAEPAGALDPFAVPEMDEVSAKTCRGTLGVVVERPAVAMTAAERTARITLTELLAGTPLLVKPVVFAADATYAVAAAPHLVDVLDPAAVDVWRAHLLSGATTLSSRNWSSAVLFALRERAPGVLTGSPVVDAPVDALVIIAGGQPSSTAVFQAAVAPADAFRAAGGSITAVALSAASPRMLAWGTRPSPTDRRVWELVARWVTGAYQGTTFATPSADGFTAAEQAALYVIDEGSSVAANWSRALDALRAEMAARCGGTVTVQVRVPDGRAPVAVEAVAATDQDGRPRDLPVLDPGVWPRASAFDPAPHQGETIHLRLRPRPDPALAGLAPHGPAGGWSCRVDGVPVEPSTTELAPGGHLPGTAPGAPWHALDLEVTATSIITCALDTVVSP